jgi:hypothetical protein
MEILGSSKKRKTPSKSPKPKQSTPLGAAAKELLEQETAAAAQKADKTTLVPYLDLKICYDKKITFFAMCANT